MARKDSDKNIRIFLKIIQFNYLWYIFSRNVFMLTNGILVIFGLLSFEDNRACEEWSLYRGDCPVGGMRTSGYDTIDQKYCAWSGGQTLATANSICTFKNGSKCSTASYYNGTCAASSTIK